MKNAVFRRRCCEDPLNLEAAIGAARNRFPDYVDLPAAFAATIQNTSHQYQNLIRSLTLYQIPSEVECLTLVVFVIAIVFLFC